MMSVLIIASLGLLALLFIAGFAALQGRGERVAPLRKAERAELAEARATLAALKELAYEHQQLDSNLSFLIIDQIKSHERKHLR